MLSQVICVTPRFSLEVASKETNQSIGIPNFLIQQNPYVYVFNKLSRVNGIAIFVLMEDNVRPHRARGTNVYLII